MKVKKGMRDCIILSTLSSASDLTVALSTAVMTANSENLAHKRFVQCLDIIETAVKMCMMI